MNRIGTAALHRVDLSFYCRHDNRVVSGCPQGSGVAACPLRHECPATRASSTPPDPRQGPYAV